MAADRPKQYLQLGGLTILEHSLLCFLDHPRLKGLVISLAVDDPYWPTLPCALDSRIQRVDGGKERSDSVLNALLFLHAQGADDNDWVLVHDAARPNLARRDLDNLLGELADDPVGGLLAVPAKDTLKRADSSGRVTETVDRSLIWQAYTPQMFRLGALHRALADSLVSNVSITDEASAIEWAGQSPRLIEGRADNIKVTRPEDLEWLRQRRTCSRAVIPGSPAMSLRQQVGSYRNCSLRPILLPHRQPFLQVIHQLSDFRRQVPLLWIQPPDCRIRWLMRLKQ
jgi:2-C-methyl-D-erythritol 4-phosphate cytidylyltransferase